MKQLFFALALSACSGLAAATADPIPAGLPEASVGDDAASQNGAVDHPGCADWNTRSFFEAATPEDITACLIAGAHPNVADEFAKTPLHWAAVSNENVAVTEALIAAGADLNGLDDSGRTALHDAARLSREVHDRWLAGHWDAAAIRALIAAGADPNARSQGGWTPLHSIARGIANATAIEVLIAEGADLNVRDSFGRTPLHFAGRYNGSAVVGTLIAEGADPNARDKLGKTPLHDVLRVAQNAEVVIAAGVPVGTRDQRARTPLHSIAGRMVWEDDVNVVETLIAHDADVEALDGDGNTPLHLAASSGSQYAVAAVGALLNAGAEVDAPNGDGNTPLHLASSLRWRPAANVNALLDAGADALRENAEGQTPGDLASDNEALKDSDVYRSLNDTQPDAR